MANLHHTIDYVELDVGGSMAETRGFYEQAFGWSFNDYGPEYAGIRGPDKEDGGLRLASDVRAGGPLVMLHSENLEDSAEAVTAAGGTIAEPISSFPGGRRFEFADPDGNRLGVWST